MTRRTQELHDAIDLIADAYGIDRAALAYRIDMMADEAHVYARTTHTHMPLSELGELIAD